MNFPLRKLKIFKNREVIGFTLIYFLIYSHSYSFYFRCLLVKKDYWDSFKTVILKSSFKKNIILNNLYESKLPISKTKYDDLQHFCSSGVIPNKYLRFYQNLAYGIKLKKFLCTKKLMFSINFFFFRRKYTRWRERRCRNCTHINYPYFGICFLFYFSISNNWSNSLLFTTLIKDIYLFNFKY